VEAALRIHQRLGKAAGGGEEHHDSQILLVHIEGRAASPLQGTSRRFREAWKISDSDYSERKLWDKYVDAFEAALSRCSTGQAPWFIIPSNHKWFRNFAVSQIVADAMEDMKLSLPKPTVDLQKIRKLYHQAIGNGHKTKNSKER
jgi:Polyphosphate kinase 2 (PPK2)